MSKSSRFYVASLAVLLSYNAYGAGYVCDSLMQYNSCKEGLYMVYGQTNKYDPVPSTTNDCRQCPTNAAYCAGGVEAPLYAVTLDPNGGTAGAMNTFYVAQSKADTNTVTYCMADAESLDTCATNTSNQLPQAAMPTYDRYHSFVGFFTEAEGGTMLSNSSLLLGYPPSGGLTGTAPATLYAQWEQILCYPGEYMTDDGCQACPATTTSGPAYCEGDLYKPLFTVTLQPTGGTVQANHFWIGIAEAGNKYYCDVSVDTDEEKSECVKNAGGSMGLTLPLESKYIPTRDKHAFLGWSLTPPVEGQTANYVIDANGAVIGSIPADASTTLYAWWETTSCEPGQYLDESKTCQSCPENYKDSSGAGTNGIGECYLITKPGYMVGFEGQGEMDCQGGFWCPGSVTVYYDKTGGMNQCPGNYRSGGNNLTAEAECAWNVPGGSYVKNAKDVAATACESGEWKAAHTVKYGETSAPQTCAGLDGQKGESAEPRDAVTTCFIPAEQSLTNTKGDYVFTEDCKWTE